MKYQNHGSTRNVIRNFHQFQIPTDHGAFSWQVCGLAEEYRQIVAVLQANPQLLGQLEDDVFLDWNFPPKKGATMGFVMGLFNYSKYSWGKGRYC